ncbi:CO dehydrogenase maturation factor [Natranaerovirga pectinivora]|uniref:CO dehydrogenase maturation factor n=1 Tax=Natranaerovirga pectinivora TaxID=682400 RepID=A0A4R3MNJ8_9FIRM|nr:hypothetical protein [Natranaerovirga pectinivora]TCT16090.1 CO dehydrogenase maturation factor [Natranaerovirga pectinivora]
MRVGFFGKGGSGKTTVAAGFINYMKNQHQHILAIDADMNVHLGRTLQMEANPICNSFEDFIHYLEEDRISKSEEKPVFIGTTPPSQNSRFIRPKKDDPFIKKYATQKGNISLITVGSYSNEEVGHSCYHGKLGVLELAYNHLLDDEKDIVIADSTAGVDSVGTSMFLVYDINIFVVEPTQRSLSVYLDFLKITENYKLNTYVIGNKINDEEDLAFLEKYIPKDKLIGIINNSNHLRRFEQGNINAFDVFTKNNEEVFEKISRVMRNTEKNWDKYYSMLLDVYKASCKEWYNGYYGQDLEKYIEPEFSYEKVVMKA